MEVPHATCSQMPLQLTNPQAPHDTHTPPAPFSSPLTIHPASPAINLLIRQIPVQGPPLTRLPPQSILLLSQVYSIVDEVKNETDAFNNAYLIPLQESSR